MQKKNTKRSTINKSKKKILTEKEIKNIIKFIEKGGINNFGRKAEPHTRFQSVSCDGKQHPIYAKVFGSWRTIWIMKNGGLPSVWLGKVVREAQRDLPTVKSKAAQELVQKIAANPCTKGCMPILIGPITYGEDIETYTSSGMIFTTYSARAVVKTTQQIKCVD